MKFSEEKIESSLGDDDMPFITQEESMGYVVAFAGAIIIGGIIIAIAYGLKQRN